MNTENKLKFDPTFRVSDLINLAVVIPFIFTWVLSVEARITVNEKDIQAVTRMSDERYKRLEKSLDEIKALLKEKSKP